MNARSQALSWLLVLAAALLVVWLLSAILFPFVLGIALAYFLDPAAVWLERRGWSRMTATVLIAAGFFGAGLLLLLLLIPPVVEQAADLLQRLPGLVSRLIQSIGPLLARALNAIGADQPEGLHQTLAGNLQRTAALGLKLLKGLMGGGAAVINVASLLTITPLTTFYVLRQWPRIVATVDDWLPRDHADTVRGIMRDVDVVLRGFLHGSVIVCAALAAFYGIALSLAGLDSGLTIGLAAGALSFIPYVGTIFGLVASVGVAFLQFWPEWIRVAVILGIFLVGQLLADYVLTPRVMGSRLAVHPLWLIFGLFAGGARLRRNAAVRARHRRHRRPHPLLHRALQGLLAVSRNGRRLNRSTEGRPSKWCPSTSLRYAQGEREMTCNRSEREMTLQPFVLSPSTSSGQA